MTNAISEMAGTSASWHTSGASSQMAPSPKMSNLFDAMDTSGQGTITKANLDTAFSTLNPPQVFKSLGSSALYSQLDPQGTGSVSKTQFVQTMTSLMSSLRAPGGSQGQDTSSSAAGQASNTLSTSLSAMNAMGGSIDLTA